jgi:hypothetical protein
VNPACHGRGRLRGDVHDDVGQVGALRLVQALGDGVQALKAVNDDGRGVALVKAGECGVRAVSGRTKTRLLQSLGSR